MSGPLIRLQRTSLMLALPFSFSLWLAGGGWSSLPAQTSETSDGAPVRPAPAAPLIPAADSSPAATDDVLAEIRPARFQELTPGSSTREAVVRELGDPLRDERMSDEKSRLTYKIGPFPRVELELTEDVLTSVVIEIDEPQPLADVVADLDLDRFDTTVVRDGDGGALGAAIPERAILLVFAGETEPPNVSHIVLEPITAEPFVWRASHDRGLHVSRSLQDAERALAINPDHAQAAWLKARILSRTGDHAEALEAARIAVLRAPEEPAFQMVHAALRLKTGEVEEGRETLEQIVQDETVSPWLRGRAACELGRAHLDSAPPDYSKAVEHLVQAIELVRDDLNDPRADVHHEISLILLDAHLDIGLCVAAGNWADKDDVVPRWLEGGAMVVQRFQEDRLAAWAELRVLHRTLEADAHVPELWDPVPDGERFLELARDQINTTTDTLHQRMVEDLLADGLYHAAECCRARGEFREALRFAENAEVLLAAAEERGDASVHDQYRLGCCRFLLGAVHAVSDQDHEEAARWYRQALPLLDQEPLPEPAQAELGVMGERLVSMGVTFWTIGEQAQAITLTEKGAVWMETAVREARLAPNTLAVPYGNLAAMLESVGRADRAREYSRKAARLDNQEEPSRRR